MRERRALRFVVEALFLGALAGVLAFSELEPLEIAGVMLAGWLVVALYEWATTRELPHFGRGLPPRYYVPQVALPPPRQLEQLRSGYPASTGDGDEATWVATPEMRAEALREWPVDVVLPPAPGEDTMVVAIDELAFEGATGEPFHEDTWIELDPVAEGGQRDDEAAEVVAEPELAEELEAVEAPVVEAVVAEEVEVLSAPVASDVDADAEPPAFVADDDAALAEGEGVGAAVVASALVMDEGPPPAPADAHAPAVVDSEAAVVGPAVAASLAVVMAAAEPATSPDAPVEAEVEEPEPRDVPVTEVEPDRDAVAVAAAAALAEPDVPVDDEVEDDTEEDVVRADPVPSAPAPERAARHTFDPLGADGHGRRRWLRRSDEPYVELPARPPKPRALPGTARRER